MQLKLECAGLDFEKVGFVRLAVAGEEVASVLAMEGSDTVHDELGARIMVDEDGLAEKCIVLQYGDGEFEFGECVEGVLPVGNSERSFMPEGEAARFHFLVFCFQEVRFIL